MDFEQQVNQARYRDNRARRKRQIGLSVAGAVAVAAVLYLLNANQQVRTEGRRLRSELKTASETAAQSQSRISELTSQIEQARKQIAELNQKNNILSIQAGELKKNSDQSKTLAEQLSDAYTELDQVQARVKDLMSELESLRQANGLSGHTLARQSP
jgi:chromosome segregation ATPase